MEQERKKKTSVEKKQNDAVLKKTRGLLIRAAKVPLRLMTEVSEAFWETAEREKGEKSLKEKLEPAAFFLAILAVSAIISLAAFPLQVYPAGFALLSSVGGGIARKKEEKIGTALPTAFYLTVLAGVLISCMFLEGTGIFYLIAYMILFFSRAGITGGRFDDSVLSRVTFSAACATGLGLFLSLLKGFTVNSVFSAISMGIVTPFLTYLICGFYIYSATEGVAPQRSHRRVYLEATVLTLAYLFLYALREAKVFGFSLPFVLAVVMMLLVARRRGALYGAAAGLVGGMACLSSMAPALAVAGFFAGLFFEYSAGVAAMVSFVSACGYSLYAEGFQMFGLFTADYLCGLLLFFPLIYFFPAEKKVNTRTAEKELMHKETVKRTKQKLKEMSEAFSSLSEVFYTVGDSVKKPGLTESTRLVSDCCSRVCSRCTLSALCWGESHGMTVNATTEVAAKLLSKGTVTESDFPEPFATRCQKLSRLVEIINRKFTEMSGSCFKNNKTSLLAGEYSTVSRLLKSTAGELDRELEYNPNLEGKAKKILKDLNISHRRVAVFGQREMRIDVYGIVLEKVGIATVKLLEEFGKAFDCTFDAPAFLMYEDNVVMRLRKKRKISLECAKSGCTKKGESVSGDSASFFETDRDYFYTLICDGMGSGREAAFTSRLASIFIEKLMHCATPKNVTLEMLNTFLMSKTDETFTSVDLLEVDLLSGNANFIKAGAAPSFVLRGDRLHRIESRTPPAGALVRMCAEQTGFTLRDGDFVIQLSDGAEDSGEGSGWLVKLLAASSFESAADLCDLLFTAAKAKGDFRDDLSISVLKVMNAK